MSRGLGSATAILIGVAAFAAGIFAALNLPDYRTDDREAVVIVAAPAVDGSRELSKPKPRPEPTPSADVLQPVPPPPAAEPYYPADDDFYDDDFYEYDDDYYESDDDWDEWDDD